jgi:hypothetical protein
MASATWAGADLVAACTAQHAHGRDCALLGGLAGAAGLWLAAGGASFRSFAACVAALAALAAGLELILSLSGRDRGDRCADDMIVAGFHANGRADPVSLAVEARRRELSSPATRRRLADAIRRAVRVECARGSRLARQVSALPPVRGLAANAALAELIATRLEQEPCDPRAVVLVARILEPQSDLVAWPSLLERNRQVRGDLLHVARLLDAASEARSRAR